MNLLIVPFHDWRKIILEGFRTRDAHFIEELDKNKDIVKIIINRPTTLVEIILKRKLNLIKGEIILKKNGFRLYKINKELYVIDFVSSNFIGQIKGGYKWFIQNYGNHEYIGFINDVLDKLNIGNDYYLLNQNIFASELTKSLKPKISVFDAWDNFTKFTVYEHIKEELKSAYHLYAKYCDFWITNSKDNIIDFSKWYKPKDIILITNGVDVLRFKGPIEETPEDMKVIPRPIVGFGGKITQLIDVELLNKSMAKAKNISFVFVGQILDKKVFSQIEKCNNFYYLGDKHYDIYPNYVKSFDVCIVPYVVKREKKSGANTIKVYEYLATDKKVVGTNSNGLEDLKEHLYIVQNANEFASEISDIQNNKKQIDLDYHSWKTKTKQFLRLLD
ncbi:glycosyltransferase [Arenibacter sp. ARW7G5Y1]|uniref:glycosyltransferase n=1 Tax=Arenibacter sp. ARW7G5Y1 TaxID=2135619 RepID=UPI000D76B290|nr:glycosyltransferase [Arenibacter sp. ARW7G5Y1]PXX27828.1 glycosyl transferase family 1 [Arenibacter sp. ARW7G5Y1]|tara:strand:+ start:19751 stop:20917 length:1167 start_codon:yes stop_codon:yes gene_type:complete